MKSEMGRKILIFECIAGSDGKKRLRCRYCVKEYFETEQQRREHVVMEHAVRDSSRSYPFMCSKCGNLSNAVFHGHII